MVGAFMTKYLGANWKTTGLGILVFLGTVPSLITAVNNWAHHQPADWRGAALGILVAMIGWASKDSTTHSTVAQVEQATIVKETEMEKK